MIQDIGEKKLDNQYHSLSSRPGDYVLIFRGNAFRGNYILLGASREQIELPRVQEFPGQESRMQYLFSIDEDRYFLLLDPSEGSIPSGYDFEGIRTVLRMGPDDLAFACTTGYHLYCWYRDNRFCGRCGEQLQHGTRERMLSCPKCGNMIFPKIAPAVIIGLRSGNRLLMSQYAGRGYKGRALLAGFCEIGETPEQTVVREVMEEVGLKAANVSYFGSQPWGVDSNLLLGYFADLDGDDTITLDEEELACASFVDREEIAADGYLRSLTATMIEAFRNGNA